MKSFLLRAGLFTCLIFLGWSHEQASAEMNFPSKCTSYGEIKPNQNPSPQQMNCLLTNAALEANIPPEVVKAVATQESGWTQFTSNGQPYISSDGGIGVMQITNQASYDQEKLKNDIYYNIQAGVELLNSNYNRTYTDLPKIKGVGRDVIENWYFPVMAYNGTKPVNSPLIQANGSKNTNAYQEKVFAYIEYDSYLTDTKLAQFPFQTTDFDYNPYSGQNIIFNKLEYTITDQLHASAYSFKKGDKVVVTKDDVKLRSQPDSSLPIFQFLGKNTTLIIDGDFLYDQSNSKNKFVWYPVKTADQKLTGYVSSAYIIKKLDAPVVSPVDDNDLSISGKAPFSNVMIQIMNGTLPVGSTVADATGDFKAEIPAQKAGTNLTVTYKDKLNELSPAATISVADTTPPPPPIVNPVYDNNNVITGVTEPNATIIASLGGVQIGSSVAGTDGKFTTGIPHENAGSIISVTSTDVAGNISQPTNVTVVKSVLNGWVTENGKRYYYINNVKQTGWLVDSGKKYYLDSTGAMKTGWLLDKGKWYYFNKSTGLMTTNTWVLDGKWYYLDNTGAMKTGWFLYNKQWYFFNKDGSMSTGWVYTGGKWYYLYSSGIMAHDTKIGSYRLGHDGAWIR
jgi:Bacterial Ig domain/Choline-binding repeat/Transglycosylase SLT domain/Bacterial SH3 domain